MKSKSPSKSSPPVRKASSHPVAKLTSPAKSTAPQPGVFHVPDSSRGLNPLELPLSTRLENALRGRGVARLGELHGVPERELREAGNCGATTVAELHALIIRAAAGEFSAPDAAARKPAELLPLLDALVAKLPTRNRTILRVRLGAETGRKTTLAATGDRYDLTRERVRQVIDLCVSQLRRTGSLRLKFYLTQLEAHCRKARQPLSTGLLAQWLGAARNPDLEYYVRLVCLLQPSLDQN